MSVGYKQIYNHSVEVNTNVRNAFNACNWCSRHCGGKWGWDVTDSRTIKVFFENEQDCFLFSLKFGGR